MQDVMMGEKIFAKSAQEKQEKPKADLFRLIRAILFLGLLVTLMYLIPNFLLQRTIVTGPSMENTFFHGDNVLVEKLSYRMDRLKRFDVIVFSPYGKEKEDYYIKRIIGMPGEVVQIIEGIIYINNVPLYETFGNGPIEDPGISREQIFLEKDEFFVLGDNRAVSLDSRYPEVGNVKKENIGGRVFLRVSPLKEFGWIK